MKEGLHLAGKITVDTYRAGMVEAIGPYLKAIAALKNRADLDANGKSALQDIIDAVKTVKSDYFIRTAVECSNLIMGSPNFGLDIIIQRLVGINTYSLNILFGEIGTGTTTPSLGDTGLTTPTNRVAVGFQQNFGSTDAIVQFFVSDSQLANATYTEFGTFIDGNATIGTGQIFNHALLSPTYTKVAGQDTSIQVDISVANS
jgi:hypothetical protein